MLKIGDRVRVINYEGHTLDNPGKIPLVYRQYIGETGTIINFTAAMVAVSLSPHLHWMPAELKKIHATNDNPFRKENI